MYKERRLPTVVGETFQEQSFSVHNKGTGCRVTRPDTEVWRTRWGRDTGSSLYDVDRFFHALIAISEEMRSKQRGNESTILYTISYWRLSMSLETLHEFTLANLFWQRASLRLQTLMSIEIRNAARFFHSVKSQLTSEAGRVIVCSRISFVGNRASIMKPENYRKACWRCLISSKGA